MCHYSPTHVSTAIMDVETPALLLDLDAFERNLDLMATFVQGRSIQLRPHAKTHRCPMISWQQIARGAIGICCQTVGEAEIMVKSGIKDVLVTNQIVSPGKARRFASLAKFAQVRCCLDHLDQLRILDEAAKVCGVQIEVLVEIDIGNGRSGVAPDDRAVELAAAVNQSGNLQFVGLQAYYGKAQSIRRYRERRAAVLDAVQEIRKTMDLLKKRNLNCQIVSGGGTGTFDIDAELGILTELQAGSYAFMDGDYLKNDADAHDLFPRFQPSLFVLASVLSYPISERAVVDVGVKNVSVDCGLPVVFGRSDVTYYGANDEHGRLNVESKANLAVGDRIWLIPGHCDPTINLYDTIIGFRNLRLEAIWPISARGASH